jgi:chromate transporter
MVRTLCPDRARASIAVAAALIVLLSATSIAQIAAIACGAAAGLFLCRDLPLPETSHLTVPTSQRASRAALIAFFALLIGLPLVANALGTKWIELFGAFYRSGALVFGGGHVVLPLLREAVVTPGWVSDEAFLAGYGVAQAIPGPLFTFAAYLGSVAEPSHRLLGALVGLSGIFLPGFLVLLGTLPWWSRLRQRPAAQSAMRGVNAAVVGLLGAALYDPVWVTSIKVPADFAVALIAFILLQVWRTPPLVVVILSACGGMALSLTAQ